MSLKTVAIFKRFEWFKKALLTIFLTSNIILVATGSAELNQATDSASFDQSTQSAELATDSAEVEGQTTTSTNQTAPPLKIDPTGQFVEDELIVKFEENFPEEGQKGVLQALNTTLYREDEVTKAKLLKVDPQDREKVLKALAKNPQIEYVERNGIGKIQEGSGGGGIPYPNDPKRPYQWGLDAILSQLAWNFHQGSSSVTVAVLDTGVNYNHPDFGSRVLKGKDFVNNDDDPMDDNGHGTRVAGIIGAIANNRLDITPVDWNARILAIKVGDQNGTVTSFQMAQGINWAVANYLNLKVINISAAFGTDDVNLRNAVANAVNNNKIVVAGTFNGSVSCLMGYPANYDGVIAVVAVTNNAFGSGCSGINIAYTNYILLSAPGWNTWTLNKDGGAVFVAEAATSYAVPFVSGAASILTSCTTPANAKLALRSNADDMGSSGYDDIFGYGRINLYRAVTAGC